MIADVGCSATTAIYVGLGLAATIAIDSRWRRAPRHAAAPASLQAH
jgi:hypothetical protein